MSGPTAAALQRLLVASPDALLVARPGGDIAFASDRAGALFGWSPDALVGVQLQVLLGGPDDEPGRARRRDGTTFPAEVTTSVVDDVCGDVLTLVAVRDISDRRPRADGGGDELRRQVEQAQHLESLGQLAGGVAHDFNNLISVIMNYATLITRRVDDPAVLADLAEIDAAARRAAGLTRQVMSFANGTAAQPEPIEVNLAIAAVVSMLDRTLGEHIELRTDLWPAPLVAVADRHQLEQIVVNLVLNARDALPSGGTITIETAPTGPPPDPVLVVVRDDGTGMPPDVAARAFEPYFTTKAPGEGTGLGLATVARIARWSGGEVSLASEVGRGTAVTVSLRGGDRRRAPAPVIEPAPPRGGQERVLLAEDDDALRTATARLLEDRGYDVVLAPDGAAAVALVEADRTGFDLVVADVTMPGPNAEDLRDRLADLRPDLPVVFVTGYGTAPDPDGSGWRVLRKPVPEAVLLRTIREVLDAR